MIKPTPVALAEIKRIAEFLREACGDDDQAFIDMIEGETNAFEALEYTHQSLLMDEEIIEGMTARMTALNARLDRYKARKEAKRKAIGQILRAAGLKKAELTEATVSVRDGKRRLVVTNDAAVPDDMQRIKRTPDMSKINVEFAWIDGVSDGEVSSHLPNWLALSEPKDTITIRGR